MALQENIGTFTLTGTSTIITAAMGFRIVAFKLASGTGSFTGTLKMGNTTSAAISLVIDEPVTISGDEAIDGLTIDASGGVINIIVRN